MKIRLMLDLLKYLPYNKKTFNRFSMIFQRRILKKSYVRGFPYKMTFDVCNLCPLKCKLCPTGQGKKGRYKGMMTFSTFKNVIDDIGDYLFYINLYNWGEPLLNKEIYKMISYASKKKISTLSSTSFGGKFTERDAEEMVKAGLDILIVSLDGATQKTAEVYQKGINVSKIMNDVRMIADKKKELGKKVPVLRWRFIVMKHNQQEIRLAKTMVKKFGFDCLELAKVRPDMANEIFMDASDKQFDSFKEWLPDNENFSLYNLNNKKKKLILKNDCSWLWGHSVVNWNGSVSPCELIYDERYDFGNVNDKGFMAIWNNSKYVAARKDIKGKNSGINTICSICHKHNAME